MAKDPLIEDVLFMAEHGVEPPDVARRLDIPVNTLQTYLSRHGVAWPWVYDGTTRSWSKR